MNPTRTVSFLFTDIEGSTALWEQHPELMKRALAKHDRLLRHVIDTQGGSIFKTAGDAFYAAFGSAADALAAAVMAQRKLQAAEWGETPLKVRMALHTGVAEERDNDFFGADVNRADRLLSAGNGGQVLLTGPVQQLVRNQLPGDLNLRPLGLFRFKGLANPEHVYQVVGPGLPDTRAPLLAARSPVDNLPTQVTTFVGRDKELADLARLLNDPSVRLITIFGQGGLGKTRLATEAAKSRVTMYDNGVAFVSLVGATSEQAVINTMADALGVQLRSGAGQSQQMLDYLQEKQLLLLLDNFDLALDHATYVSEILNCAPKVTVLATSREKLGLQEEQFYRISGLDHAAPGHTSDVLSLDAHQLFLQGARRVRPDFEPYGDDVAQIARICRLVDGSPLAILLAAAWIELLTPQEIGDEIENNLDILSTDLRNVPERQRSIKAVIESTFRQLEEPERKIFTGLSTFRGGFTREAAQDVTSASLRQLMRLSNKSLIWRDRTGRFQLHQLPLQFAREKLAAEPDANYQIRSQHSQYYAGLLAQLGREPSLERSARLISAVGLELNNVRAGWRWAAEWGTLEQVQGYSAGLRRFFDERGWYLGGAEDVATYKLALQRIEADSLEGGVQPRAFCHLHEILGDIAMLSGQYDETREQYVTALAQMPDGEHLWMARLERKMANTHRGQTNFDSAFDAYSRSAEILCSEQNRNSAWWQEWIQIQLELAWLNYWQGDSEEIATLNEEIRPKVEQHGTLAQQVNFFNALGAMGFRRAGYLDTWDSTTFTRVAYERSIESGNPHDIAWSAFTHGFSFLWCSEYERAEELMHAALALAREYGDFVHQARCATYLTILYRKQGDFDSVQQFAEMSLTLANKTNMPEYIGTAHANLAWLAWSAGNYEDSANQANKALATWLPLGQQHASITFKWTALWPLIGLAMRDGRIGDAVEYAGQLIEPGQQRLPDGLREILEYAGQAWADHNAKQAWEFLISAMARSDLRPPLSDVIGETEPGPQQSLHGINPKTLLTSRESEVLALIAAGYSNKEIAERLFVEVSTVKKHINHLFAKLQVNSRTRAIVRAQELKLI